MTVDVLYEGLTIAHGAPAREEADGLFVELEAPVPVGTRLVVRANGSDRPARVERVHEGVGPGVLLKFGAAAAKPAPAAATFEGPATIETPIIAAPDAEPEPAPDAARAAEKTPEAEDPEPDPKKGGRQRKKSRKTVIGR